MEPSQKKALALATVIVVLSTAMFLALAFVTTRSVGPGLLISTIVVGHIYVAFMVFTLGLLSRGTGVAVAITLAVIATLIGRVQLSVTIAAIFNALALIAAQTRVRAEIDSRIKYKPWLVYPHGTRLVALGVLVLVAGLAAPNIIQQVAQNGIKIPETTLTLIVEPLVQSAAKSVPVNVDVPTAAGEIPLEVQTDTIFSPKNIQTIATNVTTLINEQLSSVTQNSPILSTTIVLVIIILLLRVFAPIIALLSMTIVSLLSYIAQKTHLAQLIKERVITDRLQL